MLARPPRLLARAPQRLLRLARARRQPRSRDAARRRQLDRRVERLLRLRPPVSARAARSCRPCVRRRLERRRRPLRRGSGWAVGSAPSSGVARSGRCRSPAVCAARLWGSHGRRPPSRGRRRLYGPRSRAPRGGGGGAPSDRDAKLPFRGWFVLCLRRRAQRARPVDLARAGRPVRLRPHPLALDSSHMMLHIDAHRFFATLPPPPFGSCAARSLRHARTASW